MPPADPRLGAVRAAHAARHGGARRDLGYTVYAVVMLLAVAAVPAVRLLFVSLTEAEPLRALSSADAPAATALVAGSALALIALLGAVRGPAHYPPFLAFVLTSSDLDRYRVLRRPFALSAGFVGVGAAVVCAVPGIALRLGDVIEWQRAVPIVLGGAAFGAVACVVWAWGQRLGPRRAWGLAGGIVAAVAVTAVLPGAAVAAPWGWLAMLYPSVASAGLWPLVALAALAALGVAVVRPLLDGISASSLIDQSRRWESAATAAVSGDPSLALSTFRPLPTVGRRWTAVSPHLPGWMTFWWRDLVGACRTPVRFAIATLGLAAGGTVTAWGATTGGWALGCAGALVAFASLGGLSDGLRHASEAFGAPQLYGLSRVALLRRHASMPLSIGVAAMLLGAGLAALAGASASGLAAAAALGVALFAVRLFDSAKGPLPPGLLGPVPTPVGDLSGAVVLVWEADAALLVLAVGALVALSVETGGWLGGVAAAVTCALAVVLLAARRLRRG